MTEKNNSLKFEVVKKGLNYKILMFLHTHKNRNMYGGELTKAFPSTDCAIFAAVAILENSGLIKKEIRESKRIKYLSLTTNGKKLVKLLYHIDDLFSKQSVGKVHVQK